MKKASRVISMSGIIIAGSVVCQSCFLFKSKETSNRLSLGSSAQIGDNGSLSLAETMLNEVMLTLINSEGYSRVQARTLAEGALSIMTGDESGGGANLALAAKIDVNNILQVAPTISEGMITGMNRSGAGLDDDEKKTRAVGNITSALFKTLSGKMDKLTDAEKISLPGSITNKAISSLDEGGITSDKIGAGAGSIMKESVTGLGSMGFAAENITAAVKQVTKEGIGAISNTNASAATVQDTAKNIVEGAVSALNTLKESSTNETPTVSDMVGPIVSSAVGALKNVTFTSGTNTQTSINNSTQMQSIVGNMMVGAVTGLNTGGVTTAAEMNTALTSATSNAISGLKDAGLSTQQVTYALDDIVKGTVSTLGNIGMTNADSIKTISSTVTSTALTSTLAMIDTNTANGAAMVKNAALMSSQGAMMGLGDLTQKNGFKTADLQSATEAVTKSTISDLVVASKANTSIHIDVGFITTIAEGVAEGLYKSGVGSSVVTSVSTSVGTGASQGVTAAAALGATTTFTAAEMNSVMTSSVNTVVSEMQTRCEQSLGKWDATKGVCQYPTAAAPTTTTTVSADQLAKEQACLTQGGESLYTATGSYVCIVSDTTPPKDPSNVAFAHRYCTTNQLTMSWMTDTADTSLKTHSVKLCSSNDCNTGCSLAANATGMTATLTGTTDKTYYGCVQAVDDGNNKSAWIASASPVTIDTSFHFSDSSATCDDENLIVSWQPVAGATSYDVNVYDRTCTTKIGTGYEGLTTTTLAAAEDLASGTLYCIRIAAKDSSGDIIASSNVVDNFGDTYVASVTSADMVFERSYYQTRSVKRVLIGSSFLPQGLTSATVNGLVCSVSEAYTGSYDALVFNDQSALRALLTYGTTANALTLTVVATGVPSTQTKSSIFLQDFAIKGMVTTTSFGSDNLQVKNNYQGWVNTLSSSVVTGANGNILLTGFERIVNY